MSSFLYIQRTWRADEGISNQSSVYLQDKGRSCSASKEDSSELVAVIKMGWLDKNAPQGYEGQHIQ